MDAVNILQYVPSGKPAGAFLLLTVIFIAAETLYRSHQGNDGDHDIGETAASIGVALGDLATRTLTSALAAAPFFALHEYRIADLSPTGVWYWVALFLGVEFCYYWFHRASHRIRWLWATHAVHHSATHFNLSAAIRLGWTGQLTGAFVFFLPLAVIGFHPLTIGMVLGISLLYQFFLHTALPVYLGPLEWLLNTPAHHRVHHASNEHCLDKNYGSVLIIWDRLFGTFATAPKDQSLQYGVKGRALSYNPIKLALREWIYLFRDIAATPGLFNKLKVLFGSP